MTKTIQCDIVSAHEEIFSGQAVMVFATGIAGELGITPRHAPLLTDLRPGEVRLQMPGDADELFFYVTGGILEVQPHLVTVLADTALHAEQLDENAAMEARKEAEEAMKGATGKEDIEKAQEQLVEAAARYRAAQKLRGKR